AQRTIDVRGRIKLEATSSGFADVRRQGGNWLVAFGNTYIARVKSRPVPDLLYSSPNTLVIGRCSVSRPGYNLSAFTLTGSFLWRQHWDQCRFSPVVRHSEKGGRFAAGSVALRLRTNSDPGQPEFAEEGLLQHVQVLDTATGNSILALSLAPAVLDGQNFSLSPEGSTLAVVSGEELDVYQLPEMTPEDRARYVAVKSDVTSLTVPSAQTNKPGEEPIYSSSADLETNDAPPADNTSPTDSKDAAAKTADTTAAKPPESKDDPIPTLTLRTGTQIVAVDVVVTDSPGHFVENLNHTD